MTPETLVDSLAALVRGGERQGGQTTTSKRPAVAWGRAWSRGCDGCEGADEVECSNFLDAVVEMCRAPYGVFVASRLHALLRPDTQRLLKHGVSHPDAQVAATTLQLLALLLGSGEAVSMLAEGALAETFLRDLLLECALQRAARGNPQPVRQAALELACVASHAQVDTHSRCALNGLLQTAVPPHAVLEALDEPDEALDVADAARRYLCAMLLSMPDEPLHRSAGGEGEGQGQGQGQGGGAVLLSEVLRAWLSARLAAYEAACGTAARDAEMCDAEAAVEAEAEAARVPAGPPTPTPMPRAAVEGLVAALDLTRQLAASALLPGGAHAVALLRACGLPRGWCRMLPQLLGGGAPLALRDASLALCRALCEGGAPLLQLLPPPTRSLGAERGAAAAVEPAWVVEPEGEGGLSTLAAVALGLVRGGRPVDGMRLAAACRPAACRPAAGASCRCCPGDNLPPCSPGDNLPPCSPGDNLPPPLGAVLLTGRACVASLVMVWGAHAMAGLAPEPPPPPSMTPPLAGGSPAPCALLPPPCGAALRAVSGREVAVLTHALVAASGWHATPWALHVGRAALVAPQRATLASWGWLSRLLAA